MANVNIRVDDELKKEAEYIFSELGLNMSTAMIMFLKESVRYRGIPFTLRLPQEDLESLTDAVRAYESGKLPTIDKTMRDLESMDDE